MIMTRLIEIESRPHNSTYKKLAAQWVNEAWCFVSSSVVVNSFRLRNRQLLVAAKRYAKPNNMNLIEEIINDLIDKKTSVTTALLKTKVLAKRIDHIELSKWVDNELNGYHEN